MNHSFPDLIYLCRCAVHQQVPDPQRIQQMDLKDLYSVSYQHTLTAITAFALESAGVQHTEFQQAKEKAIRKNLLLDHERTLLLQHLEQNGVWYLPLKGCILKDFYPKLGMRQMADNDILYDAAYASVVQDYFVARNYTSLSYQKGSHDVYEKPPVLNFEMHRSLFGKAQKDAILDYYADVKNRLRQTQGTQYGYEFSPEDFYLYITTHEFKHYASGGTGLRSLLDCYVCLLHFQDSFDWDYIQQECRKLELDAFEQQSRQLALALFSQDVLPELAPQDQAMLDRYLYSGTYGNVKNAIQAKQDEYIRKTGNTAKRSYLLHRIFPNLEFYRKYYPFFYQHKLLLPVGWCYRFIRAVFSPKSRSRIRTELSYLQTDTDLNKQS